MNREGREGARSSESLEGRRREALCLSKGHHGCTPPRSRCHQKQPFREGMMRLDFRITAHPGFLRDAGDVYQKEFATRDE